MQRLVMFARPTLCVLLLLSVWHGVADGARMLTSRVEGELPPCKDVPGGIPNWDCYDPPQTPLPPCDYKHQNPGIDCSTDSQKPRPPPAGSKAKAKTVTHISAASTDDVQVGGGQVHVQGELPPCKDVPGGIPNWDCYDPPQTPLPPCDYKHQNPGIDCSTDSQKPKPPPKAKAVSG
ncbi:hypothetical protein M758_4G165200 [Ceratodon purpureus]|nr:hypothetical protein M758_4G164900 [Ceratodon purpureus]KAG0619789.1 hypothetical protein M758_4G165200 [Ceratodon purpureus]